MAPYLTLMTEEAPQRDYGLCEVFKCWLVRDYKRLPETLIGPHFLASAILMIKRADKTMLIVHIS